MLCEKCKSREATILVTEVINGVKREHNLCQKCASQLEIHRYMDENFPFARLLSGILGLQAGNASIEGDETAEKLSCPVCQTTYGDFVKNGQFGCPDCYDTFGLLIGNNIKKLQGNDKHVGKSPRYQKAGYSHDTVVREEQEKDTTQEELKVLRARLQEALSEEEYEMAAKYRDEIRALTERMGEHGEMV